MYRVRKIRLGCLRCNRDDFDGVDRIPNNWVDVDEVPSCADALTHAESFDSVTFWQTHLGLCPDCQVSTRYYRLLPVTCQTVGNPTVV